MFGWFKKKTEKEKLQERYEKLLKEAYKTSHIDRRKSDELYAQADELAKQIEGM